LSCTKILFFEIPVNYQLNHLPKANLIRKTFYENFPESKYKYIPMPDSEQFITSDGVHLTQDEALTYTIYLKEKMKNYFH
jgi:hypothetical protein